MAEYIERDAICYQLEKQESIDGQPRAIRRARRIVADFPAADVVPVRHGRWIEQPHDFDLCGVSYYQCSVCGKEQQTPSNYCQFCGARMDLKGGDGE